MQDVPGFLNRQELTYACYMDPERPAVIDGRHAVRINYETYLFADSASRALFRSDPVQFCGMLTDPVTKQRFRPSADSPRYQYERVVYFFEDLDGYECFVADPESYRLPGHRMGGPNGERRAERGDSNEDPGSEVGSEA